jgi:hypothetical protein
MISSPEACGSGGGGARLAGFQGNVQRGSTIVCRTDEQFAAALGRKC